MPNPRYLTETGEAQVELLKKLSIAKKTYFSNIEEFCKKNGSEWEIEGFKNVESIFLIGSHAEETGWKNSTSDIDFKIVNSKVLPANLWAYKRDVLDPILCDQNKEKQYWIDIFFAIKKENVTFPRYDLTKYWNNNI